MNKKFISLLIGASMLVASVPAMATTEGIVQGDILLTSVEDTNEDSAVPVIAPNNYNSYKGVVKTVDEGAISVVIDEVEVSFVTTEDTFVVSADEKVTEVELKEGVIVAKRHIHATPEDGEKYGIADKEIVSVKVESDGRSLIFDDVVVRVNPNFALAMHIDTDESNAAGAKPGMMGEIL